MGEKTDEFRADPPGDGGTIDSPARPDLLRVALAAYAVHLERHARVRIPGAATPWGRSARLASLRRFDAR